MSLIAQLPWTIAMLMVMMVMMILLLAPTSTTAFSMRPSSSSSRVQQATLSSPLSSRLCTRNSGTVLSSTALPFTDADQQMTLQGRRFFESYFDFPLDDWQCQAGGALLQGANVIVCAPTGAGKTVVGEMALARHQAGIYTSPLKALSNQKFLELRHKQTRLLGPAAAVVVHEDIHNNNNNNNRIGLCTGDVSIQPEADIVVMTTEVYRNRVWKTEQRESNNAAAINNKVNVDATTAMPPVVVLDEFHYMGQPGRGGVWEECVICSHHAATQLVCLSATLSNGDALRAWMESVTGRPTILVETADRPVPLQYWFGTHDGLYPLFRNPRAGPGAALGLLGLRGDGVAEQQHHDENAPTRLPRGLHVNPALEAAAQRRMQRVQRTLERAKAKWRVQNNHAQYDEDERSSKRRRFGSKTRSLSSPREERKEKERLLKQEMRKAVPSIQLLVRRLQQKDLLPAIFFLFSRKGCDETATRLYQQLKGPPKNRLLDVDWDAYGTNENDDGDNYGHRQFRNEQQQERPPKKSRSRSFKKKRQRQGRDDTILQDDQGRRFRSKSNYLSESVLDSVFGNDDDDSLGSAAYWDNDASSPLASDNWEYYAAAGLLNNVTQVRQVANILAAFNEENEEIALNDDLVEQFLFGVGSHHAGLLPAHKSLVERLFQAQLMPVVFATETLAAGVNMPARTTVLLSMAKRTDRSAIQLLETANALQMAGRAGRRGLDEAGTCVLVATPFESHTEAAQILTNPILPIRSQFRPSYPLAIQMIQRDGRGSLQVAEQLIQKSFALWERRQQQEQQQVTADESMAATVVDMLQLTAHEQFMQDLAEALHEMDTPEAASLGAILQDREVLKKTSKSFLGLERMLLLEETTLGFLQKECDELAGVVDEDEDCIFDEEEGMLCADDEDLDNQMKIQRERIIQVEQDLRQHAFSKIARLVNEVYLNDVAAEKPRSRVLASALRSADPTAYCGQLLARQLCEFAKSAVTAQKKKRRQLKQYETAQLLQKTPTNDDLSDGAGNGDSSSSSWDDMQSIVKTLVAYGCLEKRDTDEESYEITQGGLSVGNLALDNSLWALVALGGAWDVVGASNKYTEYRQAMLSFLQEDEDDADPFDDDDELEDLFGSSTRKYRPPKPKVLSPFDEAQDLRDSLLELSPSELAGYVSCLVSDNRDSQRNLAEAFQQMTVKQHRVLEKAVVVMDRFAQVQKDVRVDVSTRGCSLDTSYAEVVTAWAAGCTWQEALELSGLAPGDLARTLSRVLDAVRQLGNLPFQPERVPAVAGLHPELRQACRVAARGMNRYPVKDPLAFLEEEEERDENDEEEQVLVEEDAEMA